MISRFTPTENHQRTTYQQNRLTIQLTKDGLRDLVRTALAGRDPQRRASAIAKLQESDQQFILPILRRISKNEVNLELRAAAKSAMKQILERTNSNMI